MPDMDPSFTLKKSLKYSGHRKLLCGLSKLSKFNAFNLDPASVLVYKFGRFLILIINVININFQKFAAYNIRFHKF